MRLTGTDIRTARLMLSSNQRHFRTVIGTIHDSTLYSGNHQRRLLIYPNATHVVSSMPLETCLLGKQLQTVTSSD